MLAMQRRMCATISGVRSRGARCLTATTVTAAMAPPFFRTGSARMA